MAYKDIEGLLVPAFFKKHVISLLHHYSGVVTDFRNSEWEDSLAKVGKYSEAVLKALSVFIGKTPPSGRDFKADKIINELINLPRGTYDDSIQLAIPRACRLIYFIASNRGGRHDPGEISANEMDASVSVPICSWIIAEMIRLSQKGAVDLEEAKALVESLTKKMYPFIEEVGDRVYFHLIKRSAPDVAILALNYQYPRRLSKQALLDTVVRHRFTQKNAKMAVQRILHFVDNDGNDQLLLLATGRRRADAIITAKAK
jgi:hypothetical protein